ncbi:MAG: glycosyltransferase [Chitinophagaceae bacterium]|nr:MAG: glycosyltransferase [Chitinophagaceae bacterium]
MEAQLISVILPVYNGGGYLEEAVQTVLAQEFTNFEFLILDDASTDSSWQYLASLTDPRIRLFRNERNRGLFYNLNFLANKSRGHLIKLWSQDDRMYPHCLERFVAFYHLYPEVGFIYSGRDSIDARGNVRKRNGTDETPRIVSSALHAKIAFFTGSIAGNIANVCIRKEAFMKVGPFNEEMKISGDFDMWVRLARYYETGFIPEKLIQLRDHSGQLSRRVDLYINHVKEDLEVYRYLQSYVAPAVREEGKKVMRNHKLVFYYTLMVKALLKRNVSAAYSFYRELARFDNFAVLTFCFLRAKVLKRRKPDLT